MAAVRERLIRSIDWIDRGTHPHGQLVGTGDYAVLVELIDERAAFLAQLEAAQKDQARYRWLRSTWCFSILERLFGIETSRIPDAQLDGAIDESIAADKAAAAARALAEQQEGAKPCAR